MVVRESDAELQMNDEKAAEGRVNGGESEALQLVRAPRVRGNDCGILSRLALTYPVRRDRGQGRYLRRKWLNF